MDAANEATLSVHVTPGARRNSVTALKEGIWYIKIAAPPVEGKANLELVAYLSKTLDLRKSNLSVLKGQTSRNKLVSVMGMSRAEVTQKLTAQMGGEQIGF